MGTGSFNYRANSSDVDPDTVTNVMPLAGKTDATVRDQSLLSGFDFPLRS